MKLGEAYISNQKGWLYRATWLPIGNTHRNKSNSFNIFEKQKKFKELWHGLYVEYEVIFSLFFTLNFQVVVANSFDEDVHRMPRDVLVAFHAPWCQHCQGGGPNRQSGIRINKNCLSLKPRILFCSFWKS